VLVAGGAGYIGSHTAVDLLEKGFEVVVVDNFSNSSEEAIHRIEKITGNMVKFYKTDLCNKSALEQVFATEKRFDFVIHFAGLKAVGESVERPLQYYFNNIVSTIHLLQVMDEYDCTNIVFSSSATVYGSSPAPYVETSTVGQGITNPYGQTKHMIEQILQDWYIAKGAAKGKWGVVLLRYFNPIGAHTSGLIGEDPFDIPNNLMPYLAQVAVGRREFLTVFGDDYDTPDGTGVRDYLHVMDLAEGHTAALARLQTHSPTLDVYNLGSGSGVSVLELVSAMEKACGKPIPRKIGNRRTGDLAVSYSIPTKAKQELNWETKRSIADCCADVWRWQSGNPNGYRTAQ
jgi:UDP-glucose 4-epimerase